MAVGNLPKFWQRRANKAYNQGYNGESRWWNSYKDENANQIPDWVEQTVEEYRQDMMNAWRAGVQDRQRGKDRNEPYAFLNILENPEIQLASSTPNDAPESGLPSEVDKPIRPNGPNVSV